MIPFRVAPLALLLIALGAGCASWVTESARPLLAVEPVSIEAPDAPDALGVQLQRLLIERLIDSERYAVLNDQAIQLRLRQATEGDETDVVTAARIMAGTLQDARCVVSLDLIECSVQALPITFPPWRRGEIGAPRALVTLQLQVTSLETGRILCSRRIEARRKVPASSSALRDSLANVGSQAFWSTALGRACLEAIDDAVKVISREIEPQPWVAMVARIDQDALVINGGADRGIQVGDRFQIFRHVAEVHDPQTEMLLGISVREPIGIVRVTRVEPRFAICPIPAGWAVERGMVLREIEVN